MKYFEVAKPYYAIIKANNRNVASCIYKSEVCEMSWCSLDDWINELNLELAVIKSTYHLTAYRMLDIEEIVSVLSDSKEGIVFLEKDY